MLATDSQPDKMALSSAWQALSAHYQVIAPIHMRAMFAEDPQRFARFSVTFDDMLFDFSKNRITGKTLELLCQLADASGLTWWREAMFSGERINHTEDRAALHVALRNSVDPELVIDGMPVNTAIRAQHARMRDISEQLRNGDWNGATGKPVTDVVNIGIGGSDLGPRMVSEALRDHTSPGLRVHFVSNLDAHNLFDTLQHLNPEQTLFIIASKSFTTQETMINARSARAWLHAALGNDAQLQNHLLAISSNKAAAIQFGISEENILEMWDWVGGRYSLWSAIGLPIAIAIGMDRFIQLLEGAHAMDQHFRTAPYERNIPVLMALIGIWYINFFSANCHAILPYAEHLKHLPAYLQQADMESNGKSVDRNGHIINYHTGPVLFGELGINSQHAFYQLLHQGTHMIPADFIAEVAGPDTDEPHQLALLSNVLAQSEALMRGLTPGEARTHMSAQGITPEQASELAAYRSFAGNKPSNTILLKTLDARTLGSLLAMYEHKIFVQGVIWNINSFDQWGVELGKHLSQTILHELQAPENSAQHDCSTNGLIDYCRTTVTAGR